MSLQRHLVIMVKAPRFGTVKTRLAAGVGRLAAWRFYRGATARLLRRMQKGRWQVWLSVTPDQYVEDGRFWPALLDRIPQGRGDLGARMARPARTLPPGPVVVIGSDVPGISVPHIEAAFRALDSHGAIVGPAADGGYWLIGLARRPAPINRLWPRLYADVRWSGPYALADTLAGLDRRLKVASLVTLSDVDTAEDYDRWRAISRAGGP